MHLHKIFYALKENPMYNNLVALLTFLEAVQDLWFLIYFYVKSEFKLWKIIPAILLGNNLN